MAKISLRKTPMISTSNKLMYASGELGFSIIVTTVSGFLMFFGTAVCGVPGTLMGLCASISATWDAVTDPIIGYYSDRKISMFFGRRHSFILVATFGMAILNILLWSVPMSLPAGLKFLWFVVIMIILDVFTTFYATPSSALGVELSGDYNERSRIQSIKSIFFLVGSLLPTLLMALLQAPNGNFLDGRYNPDSYINMAYIASSLVLVCGTICFLGSYSQIPRLRAKAKNEKSEPRLSIGAILKNFFVILKIPLYRNLVLGFTVTMMSSAFITSAGFHVLTYTFKLTSTRMYILMALLFLTTIFSQPLWLFLVRKFDKRIAMLSGMATTLFGILYLGVIFVLRASFAQDSLFYILAPALLFAGCGMGALYSLPIGMMGDAAAVEKARTNSEKTGTYTGFMTLANKLGQSFAFLLVGILLDVIGFRVGAETQPIDVEWGLGWIVILGMIITISCGMVFYSKYSLRKNDIPNPDAVIAPSEHEDSSNKSEILVGQDIDWEE